MVPESGSIPVDADVDVAMNAVLAHEREARADIERSAHEAALMLDEAEREARTIVERADRRMTAMRLRCEQATRDAVDAILAAQPEGDDGDCTSGEERTQLEQAVRMVAATLTGAQATDSDSMP